MAVSLVENPDGVRTCRASSQARGNMRFWLVW
jgi:hypothetical protein